MTRTIVTEIDQGIGIITLSNADTHNTLDEESCRELSQALASFDASREVRAIILSSTGKAFCGGTNPQWLRAERAGHSLKHGQAEETVSALLEYLYHTRKTTIARVQGHVFGSGIGLVAACDIAIASYDATFAFTEVKFGLTPAASAPFIVGAIGERLSRRYMLTAERFSASEAYRIGLLHEVVPTDEQLDEAIGEIVDAVLKGQDVARQETKALIQRLGANHTAFGLDDDCRRDTPPPFEHKPERREPK